MKRIVASALLLLIYALMLILSSALYVLSQWEHLIRGDEDEKYQELEDGG